MFISNCASIHIQTLTKDIEVGMEVLPHQLPFVPTSQDPDPYPTL